MNMEQVQHTVAATEQSLGEMAIVLGSIVLISYIFSYAITHLAKHWRNDHDKKKLSVSSSLLRSTLLAFVAFVGLWYVAYIYGAIHLHSWIAATTLGGITSPIAPLAWNPMADVAIKVRDMVLESIKKKLPR